jgi:hypothetical protein
MCAHTRNFQAQLAPGHVELDEGRSRHHVAGQGQSAHGAHALEYALVYARLQPSYACVLLFLCCSVAQDVAAAAVVASSKSAAAALAAQFEFGSLLPAGTHAVMI